MALSRKPTVCCKIYKGYLWSLYVFVRRDALWQSPKKKEMFSVFFDGDHTIFVSIVKPWA